MRSPTVWIRSRAGNFRVLVTSQNTSSAWKFGSTVLVLLASDTLPPAPPCVMTMRKMVTILRILDQCSPHPTDVIRMGAQGRMRIGSLTQHSQPDSPTHSSSNDSSAAFDAGSGVSYPSINKRSRADRLAQTARTPGDRSGAGTPVCQPNTEDSNRGIM